MMRMKMMSGAFGVGDWVECIKPDFWPWSPMRRGTIWLVTEMGVDQTTHCSAGSHCHEPWVRVKGCRVKRKTWAGYCACGFRPILRANPGRFDALLKVPADLRREQIAASPVLANEDKR